MTLSGYLPFGPVIVSERLPESLRRRIIPIANTGCWIWTGTPRNRYGQVAVEGVKHYTHRYVYRLLVGEIPEGKVLHHTCEVRRCVNPAHLSPVSKSDHSLIHDTGAHVREKAAAQTHCKRGHSFADHGYVKPNGRRRCRICHIEQQRIRRAKARVSS